MKELTVFKTKVIIKEGLINEIFLHLPDDISGLHIITDSNVKNLYYESLIKKIKLPYFLYEIEPGEKSKSILEYKKIISSLIKNNADRRSLIIGFGGGVVLDLSGFIAATYLRGVKLTLIPTTIIAQIDSSIGGKNGIDFLKIKNNIGTFYHPDLVLTDPDLLKTLPEKEIKNGLGEVIKYAFICDKQLFKTLEKGIVFDESTILKTVKDKINIVSQDEFDKGVRKLLNFGHTFAHALETGTTFDITHGEAVCYGMEYAIKLGIKLGFTNPDTLDKLKFLFKKYNLATKKIVFRDYLKYMSHDKKRSDKCIDFVFIKDISEPLIKKIDNYEDENIQ